MNLLSYNISNFSEIRNDSVQALSKGSFTGSIICIGQPLVTMQKAPPVKFILYPDSTKDAFILTHFSKSVPFSTSYSNLLKFLINDF